MTASHTTFRGIVPTFDAHRDYFRQLAEGCHRVYLETGLGEKPPPESLIATNIYETRYKLWMDMVEAVADSCKLLNDKFNRDRFIYHCINGKSMSDPRGKHYAKN